MAVKTQELCESCKYSFNNWCKNTNCSDCPQNIKYGKTCKCLKIKKGEECLMYQGVFDNG